MFLHFFALCLLFWLKLSEIKSQNYKEFCVSYSPGPIQICAYTIFMNNKIYWMTSPFFFSITKDQVFSLELEDLFICKNPSEFSLSHFLGQILVFTYTICTYCQILISCPNHSLSVLPEKRTSSCSHFLSL